jgi:hypothetical protein
MVDVNEIIHGDNGDGAHVFNGAITNVMKIRTIIWNNTY